MVRHWLQARVFVAKDREGERDFIGIRIEEFMVSLGQACLDNFQIAEFLEL